jgi:hypothetical protein
MKEGDFGSGIFLTVKNTQDEIVDLTGRTATLLYQIGNGDVQERNMTIISAAAGTIKYVFQEGDIDQDGTFYFEVVIEEETDGKLVLHLTSDRVKSLVKDILND